MVGEQVWRSRVGHLVAAVALVTVCIGVKPAPAAAWSFSTQQIADTARSYTLGTWGGQCRVWAGNVVNAVLASNGIGARVGGYGSPGGAYFGAYQNAGGFLIGINDGQPGDLIQIVNSAQKNSDYPSGGLHTAIIVARTGTAGTYTVRDSNWGTPPELIHEHAFAPAQFAGANNASPYIWRFGTIPTGPGDTDTDGDGVPDASDHCPTVPAGPRPDPESPGCPLPTNRLFAAAWATTTSDDAVTDLVRTSFAFGGAGYTPVVGDWNGDGIDTPGVYAPSTGQWVLTNSPRPDQNPTDRISFAFGGAGYTPVVGDWNGDGIDTPGVYAPSTAQWVLTNSPRPDQNPTDRITFAFGGAGYTPVVGDWNGDRTDTPAVYAPSTAQWVLTNSPRPDQNPSDRITLAWGGPGLIPLPGDWTGSGRSKVGGAR